MKLSMKEKKILYAFACPSHDNTVARLKWLTALTVETEVDESRHEAFYHRLRREMDEYHRLKRSLHALKANENDEEGWRDETVQV